MLALKMGTLASILLLSATPVFAAPPTPTPATPADGQQTQPVKAPTKEGAIKVKPHLDRHAKVHKIVTPAPANAPAKAPTKTQ